jgi:hypothetical protein
MGAPEEYKNNLLDYTLKILQNNNLHLSDVHGVIFKGQDVPIDDFITIAHNTWYDPGYGWNDIDTEFYILCDGAILAWDEYDGAEGWRVINLHYKKNGDVKNFWSYECKADDDLRGN